MHLLVTADDYGRFHGDLAVIKSCTFPMEDRLPKQRFHHWMDELVRAGLLTFYEVANRRYCQIPTFQKHNGPPRAKNSKFPAENTVIENKGDSRCTQMIADAPVFGIRITPDSDSNSNKNNARRPWPRNGLFEKFWEAYPNKRSKGQAERAWHKLAPDAALVATMLDSLAAQNAEREYLRKNRQFVPAWKHPATWLNGACWNDEVHVDPLAPPGQSVNGNCRKCNFNSTIHALRKCQESKEMFIKKFPQFEAVCEAFEPCQ